MQKRSYLKYFKKNKNFTKPIEQSFEQSLSFTQSRDRHDNQQQKNTFLSLQKENHSQIVCQKNLSFAINKGKAQQNVLNTISYNANHKNQKIAQQGLQQSQKSANQKLLPHIKEQLYEKTETTNEMLSKKILDCRQKPFCSSFHSQKPKSQQSPEKYIDRVTEKASDRNRTLESTSLYNPNASQSQEKFFAHPIKPYNRNKTAPNKKFKTLKTTFGDLNSSCRNYNDVYTISLQNQRMGWRIVNTRSMIQEYLNSSYFTYHLYNGNILNRQKFKNKDSGQKKKMNLKQMNNVFKVFFNQKTLSSLKNNKKFFQNSKPKDQMQKFILENSQVKQKGAQNKCQNVCSSPQKYHSSHLSPLKAYVQNGLNWRSWDNQKSPKRIKPSFFRSTYRKTEKPLNRRICDTRKQCQQICRPKLTSNLKMKFGCSTQPSEICTQNQGFSQSKEFQVYGRGSTIIELKNIEIQANPSIRSDDVLMLQLMEPQYSPKYNEVKGICTPALSFLQLKKGVKFAINMKSGEFIPLKIWKYHGIDIIQLGIIDLNVMLFRNRHQYFTPENGLNSKSDSNGIEQIQLYKQERVSRLSHKKQQRQILFYRIKQKLRKKKKAEIQVIVSCDCLLYNKKFTNSKLNRIICTENGEIQKDLAETLLE